MPPRRNRDTHLLGRGWLQEIRAKPLVPANIYEIYDGSGILDRDFDIPTAQIIRNGIILYYTPKVVLPILTSSGKKRKRTLEDEEILTEGHQGIGGVLDSLPVSPQVIFTHSNGQDIFAKSFMHFMKGLARSHATLTFRRDQSVPESLGLREERLAKRTAAFNYFLNDAFKTVRALGGRGFGAQVAARASLYSANNNLILWSYPLTKGSEWRKDELLALSKDKRVLFIRGENDWMAPELLMTYIREQMQAQTWIINVKGMFHSMTFKTELEEERVCNALGSIVGTWLGRHNGNSWDAPIPWDASNSRRMDLEWNPDSLEVQWEVS